ncbi:MAG: hypothetical protein FWG36_10140, partial [Oscillospiraceae bacterium]|nr:hypothetical protein [Oscillospiraceae bacterium]
MKRILSSVVAFALLVSILAVGSSVPASASSAPLGSADNPYPIRSQSDLSQMVNGSSSAYYRLEQNITVTSVLAQAANNRVRGTLDGNHYTITLQISSSGNPVGLFGRVDGVTVKNLKLAGSVSNSNNQQTGALIGSATSGSVTLDNIDSSVTVSGQNDTGGLIGQASISSVDIRNVTVRGNVKGTTQVGGIMGVGSGYFTRCSVTGDVTGTGTTTIGGLVGITSVSGRYSRFDECEMLGQVKGNINTGGIVGHAANTDFYNCRSTGTITGSREVGGIVGLGASTVNVDRCYSSSTINGDGARVGGLTGSNCHVYNSFGLNPSVKSLNTA